MRIDYRQGIALLRVECKRLSYDLLRCEEAIAVGAKEVIAKIKEISDKATKTNILIQSFEEIQRRWKELHLKVVENEEGTRLGFYFDN